MKSQQTRTVQFLSIVITLVSVIVAGGQNVESLKVVESLGDEPSVPSSLDPEWIEALVEEGLMPWIESTDDGCIRIQGTVENDWIYVEEFVDRITVKIYDLKSTDLLASQEFPTTQVWCIQIIAKAGNDRVTNNTWQTSEIHGNEGFDFIEGGYRNNTIFGGPHQDLIYSYGGSASSGNVTIVYGDSGDDAIYHFWGDGELHGGEGNDFIKGGNGNDEIYGDAGNDQIVGGDGTLDLIYGGPDDDILVGGKGTDGIWGDDYLSTTTGGNDRLYGGEGSDLLSGGGGKDIVVGGADKDEIYGDGASDMLFARDGVSDYFVDGGAGIDIFAIDRNPSGAWDPSSLTSGNNVLTLQNDPITPDLKFDRIRFQLIFGIP